MQDEYIIHLIWRAIIAVASPLFFVFMALKHHTASRWIRCVFILLAIVGVLWVSSEFCGSVTPHISRVLRARASIILALSAEASLSVFSRACCSVQSFGSLVGGSTAGLTNRWSQPLAVPMRTFNFMKPFSVFGTLALASGGSAPSR